MRLSLLRRDCPDPERYDTVAEAAGALGARILAEMYELVARGLGERLEECRARARGEGLAGWLADYKCIDELTETPEGRALMRAAAAEVMGRKRFRRLRLARIVLHEERVARRLDSCFKEASGGGGGVDDQPHPQAVSLN